MSAPAPWHRLYSAGVDPYLDAPQTSVLALFQATVTEAPDAPAIHYFGATMSRAELFALSRRIATVLRGDGIGTGTRVGVCLQNTPFFPAALFAIWGLGAIAVPLSPMLRPKELGPMLADSGVQALIAHPAMRSVIDEVSADLDQTLARHWVDPRDLAGDLPLPFIIDDNVADEGLLLECKAAAGELELQPPEPGSVAVLTYTSGTTGPSKGSMSTHRNLAYQAVAGEQWCELDETSAVLTIAPLFHITGMGLHVALALANGHPMVMTYRFEPATVLNLIDRYEPSYAVGAISAFIALMDCRPTSGPTLAKLKQVFSGGAPVPAEVVERFRSASSRYIHNIYGLTESTSACIGVPLGATAPIDPRSGALSIGVPMGGTTVTIVDDSGRPVPAGSEGEIVVLGPQLARGYWNRPTETAHAFQADGLHTGDIGIMDVDGWVYVVDRKKDIVVVSGYKVWPRDVEDVLYRHPAVKEAAVIGRPDSYRGETLHAFISIRPGESVTRAELDALCRQHLSAYKVPSDYFVMDELPKTATNKIMRRKLRDGAEDADDLAEARPL
jgi:long-chain acyl-CoA synthetase